MNITIAVVLGLVQGLTEFLPVSSSAHLILIPWFLHWPDPGLSFDVALHWGTLLAVVIYYRAELVKIAIEFFGSFTGEKTPSGRLGWYLIAATIPGAILGFLLEKKAESTFRSPVLIACTMSLLAIYLFIADRRNMARFSLDRLTLTHALTLGCAQAFALVPGVSRSGVTIATALLLGLDRPSAVRFSFLMSVPIILGAGILKIRILVSNAGDPTMWSGLFTSCLAGLAAIHLLVTYVRTRTFTPFVIYRLALAGVIVAWIFLR
jgi:undecaprenyl-diphosphatase